MALSVAFLRRWFAIGAVLVIAIVAGAYYFAKWRIENPLKKVPEKIDVEIEQSAQGFTISKSEGGRTLFKIQASKAIQYKQGGKATLHDVAITLYGRDSTRFDQIYGF
jgi:lipopolysaccharide export system protein LptA